MAENGPGYAPIEQLSDWSEPVETIIFFNSPFRLLYDYF